MIYWIPDHRGESKKETERSMLLNNMNATQREGGAIDQMPGTQTRIHSSGKLAF